MWKDTFETEMSLHGPLYMKSKLEDLASREGQQIVDKLKIKPRMVLCCSESLSAEEDSLFSQEKGRYQNLSSSIKNHIIEFFFIKVQFHYFFRMHLQAPANELWYCLRVHVQSLRSSESRARKSVSPWVRVRLHVLPPTSPRRRENLLPARSKKTFRKHLDIRQENGHWIVAQRARKVQVRHHVLRPCVCQGHAHVIERHNLQVNFRVGLASTSSTIYLHFRKSEQQSLALIGGLTDFIFLCQKGKENLCRRKIIWAAFSISKPGLQSWSIVISRKCFSKDQIKEKLQTWRDSIQLKKHTAGLMFGCCARIDNVDVETEAFADVFPDVSLMCCYGDGEFGINTLEDGTWLDFVKLRNTSNDFFFQLKPVPSTGGNLRISIPRYIW